MSNAAIIHTPFAESSVEGESPLEGFAGIPGLVRSLKAILPQLTQLCCPSARCPGTGTSDAQGNSAFSCKLHEGHWVEPGAGLSVPPCLADILVLFVVEKRQMHFPFWPSAAIAV